MFSGLREMASHPAQATVSHGVVEELVPLGPRTNFVKQLDHLLRTDENYRKIHEIGFGLNPSRGFFLNENFLPNEMRLGVHFGLGLTPYTDFHLDLVCVPIAVTCRKGGRIAPIFSAG